MRPPSHRQCVLEWWTCRASVAVSLADSGPPACQISPGMSSGPHLSFCPSDSIANLAVSISILASATGFSRHDSPNMWLVLGTCPRRRSRRSSSFHLRIVLVPLSATPFRNLMMLYDAGHLFSKHLPSATGRAPVVFHPSQPQYEDGPSSNRRFYCPPGNPYSALRRQSSSKHHTQHGAFCRQDRFATATVYCEDLGCAVVSGA